MTAVRSGLIVALAIGVLSNFGSGMRKLADSWASSVNIQDDTRKDLELVASTEKRTFTAAEPIPLSVIAKNNGQRALFIVDTYNPEWDTKFDVRNEAGENVALTEDGKRLTKTISIFRQIRIEINPGEEIRKEFVINKLFDMSSPGKYAITVKRSFCVTGTDIFSIATSNILKVTVSLN